MMANHLSNIKALNFAIYCTSRYAVYISISKYPHLLNIILVHDGMLNSKHSLVKFPHVKIFIIDFDYYQGWAINRLRFIADCLAEMPNIKAWVGRS